jgi:hypothetical protein
MCVRENKEFQGELEIYCSIAFHVDLSISIMIVSFYFLLQHTHFKL